MKFIDRGQIRSQQLNQQEQGSSSSRSRPTLLVEHALGGSRLSVGSSFEDMFGGILRPFEIEELDEQSIHGETGGRS